MKLWLVAILGAIALSSTACSSDCESLCEEARDRNCTSITANCGTFCEDLNTVAENANCTDRSDAYEACLGADDVCTGDERCSSQRNSLGECVISYCLATDGVSECSSLRASF